MTVAATDSNSWHHGCPGGAPFCRHDIAPFMEAILEGGSQSRQAACAGDLEEAHGGIGNLDDLANFVDSLLNPTP